MNKKRVPKMPEYLKGLPAEANLRMADILKIWGYKSESGFRYNLDPQTVEAVMALRKEAGSGTASYNRPHPPSHLNLWKLGDIRALVRKLQAEAVQ